MDRCGSGKSAAICSTSVPCARVIGEEHQQGGELQIFSYQTALLTGFWRTGKFTELAMKQCLCAAS